MTNATATVSPPTTEPQRRDLRGFWRVTIAIVAPLAPLSFALSIALSTTDLAASELTNLLSIYLVLPGVLALGWVNRRRAPVLTAVGGITAFVGYAALLSAPQINAVTLAAETAGWSADATTQLVTAMNNSPSYTAAILTFLIGHVVGLVLLGVALLRSRVAPRWMAIALIVAAPLDTLLGAVFGLVAVAIASFVLLAVGFASASVALLRTPTSEFDLGPGTSPAPAAGAPDLRTFWKVLLGILAGITPLYIAIYRLVMPYDTIDSAATVAEKSLANPAVSQIVEWTGSLVALTLLPGLIAVVWISRRRVPLLATIAFIVAYLGFTPLIGGGFPGDAVIATGLREGISRDALVNLLVAGNDDPAGTVLGSLFVPGHILGAILLGVALLVSRAVPRVIAIALIISQPLHFVAAVILANHPLDFVAWGLTALAFGWAGVRLIRTPNEQFDLGATTRTGS